MDEYHFNFIARRIEILFLCDPKAIILDIKEEYTHEQEKLIRMHPYLGVRYGCISENKSRCNFILNFIQYSLISDLHSLFT